MKARWNNKGPQRKDKPEVASNVNGIMLSREIPMSEVEFLRLPHDPGWTYEYARGVARIRPRHLAVPMQADVTPRAVDAVGVCIRAVAPEDAPGLVRAFQEGFRETVEYCDSSDVQIRRSGENAIQTFFGGSRGAFHPASRLAFPPDHPQIVAGAALIIRKHGGPFLDMLFLRPLWHRQGVATALVGAAMNVLFALGETHLGSAYDFANQPSRQWHEKFGFVEQPSALLARARANAARHELWRRQEIGGLAGAERAALQADAEHCECLAESLERAAFNHRAAAKGQGLSSPA